MVVYWRYGMSFDANGYVSTLLNVDWIKWMYFCINDFEVGVNDSMFSGNEQQKVYFYVKKNHEMKRCLVPQMCFCLSKICSIFPQPRSIRISDGKNLTSNLYITRYFSRSRTQTKHKLLEFSYISYNDLIYFKLRTGIVTQVRLIYISPDYMVKT